MITYNITTNFGAKDTLPAADPDKVVQGAEHTTEYESIKAAFALAAPTSNPVFTGTVTAANVTATGTVTFAGATVDDGGSVTTVDINGGTIDGAVIGGSTPAAGTFTTLSATDGAFTTLSADDGTFTSLTASTFVGIPTADLTTSGLVELATVAETNAGTDATRSVTPDGLDGWTGSAQITTLGTITSLTATTADINGGTVDAVVGSNTPAAGDFTVLTATQVNETAAAISASVINCALGNVQHKTLSSNTTFTFSNVPSTGNAFGLTLVITQGGSAYTITWPAAVKWDGGSAPSVPAATDVAIYTMFTYDGGTTWYGFQAGSDMS